MKSLWQFFASVKLAIVLLILLAVASIIGTLIPQGLAPAAYEAHYGQLAGLLMRLRFTGLYHSLWFLALLLLLAANTIVCTLSRLPAKWRRAFRSASGETTLSSVLAMKIKGRFGRNAPAASVASDIGAALASRHYSVSSKPGGDRTVLLARKRRLGHFGSDTVHLGLLVILAGGLVSGLGGFRTQLALSEGETAQVPQAPFAVRLDKFETEYYPQGAIKDWKSTVTVVEGGRPVRKGIIEVNHPLSFGGFSFYQTSYGWDWSKPRLEVVITKTGDPAFSRTVRVGVGQRVPVEDKDVTEIGVVRFVPDFVIGEGNTVQTRSEAPNNPAALIEGWKGEEKVFTGWVFANFPDFTQMHSGPETDLHFVLKSYEAPQYSVLEAARDPGVVLIWAGCVLITGGFFLAFYWPPREIRAVLEQSGSRTEAALGGHAGKNREAFEAEFENLIDALRRS